MRSLAALTALVVITAGCGDDSPTGPESDLVGSWDLVGTDFIDVFSEGLTEVLVEDGASRAEALVIVGLVLSGTQESEETLPMFWHFEKDFVADQRSTIRFNNNGTYEDNSGDEGTWRIEGNDLIMVSEEGEEERLEFFLDGDDLTVIFSGEWLLEQMRTDRDFDTEDLALMERVFDDDDVMRFFYRRR